MSETGVMMGRHEGQKNLFSYHVDLDRRVHADHPLRRVQAMVDFSFARTAVEHTYGSNGNVSVDPAVLVKLMFLLFSENVRSRRTRPAARTDRGRVRRAHPKHREQLAGEC